MTKQHKLRLIAMAVLLALLLSGCQKEPPPPEAPPLPLNRAIKGADAGEWSWLTRKGVPRVRVFKALNDIRKMKPAQAKALADTLRAAWEKASIDGKHAACLMIAAALEQAKEDRLARLAYEQVKEDAKGLPYQDSAKFRLKLLDEPELGTKEKIEDLYDLIIQKHQGWYLVPQKNQWIAPHHGIKPLLDLRADHLSIRFFRMLWNASIFEKNYAYLFILLVLTLGIKILEIPLYIKASKLYYAYGILESDIRYIQKSTLSPIQKNERIMALYRSQGVNPASGCAVFLVDGIFIMWAFHTMKSFSPQFVLDGAKFFWITDITRRDLGILVAWIIFALIYSGFAAASRQALSMDQMMAGVFLLTSIIAIAGWFAHWPAYLFIFIMVLGVVGAINDLIIRAIYRNRY